MNRLMIIRATNWSLKTSKKTCYYSSSTKIGILEQLEVEEVPNYVIEPKYYEHDLEKIRNKSRLRPQDRRKLNCQKPYDKSFTEYHNSIKYRKQMLGKYGMEAAGISPGICWPTKEEIEDKREYEKLAYPLSIQESWKQMEENKKIEIEEKRKREEEIDKVVVNFEKWRLALDAKIAKKEKEVVEAKQRKERMMEELREEYGYAIDPRDERFKQILEAKEKEDKKKKKEEKKKLKREKLLIALEKRQNINVDVNQELKKESISNVTPIKESTNDDIAK